MTDATDYDPVECPVSDCTYRDAVRSVAAHVSGTRDDRHSWDRLGYDGARDFVETEKRRQRQADGDGGATATGDSGPAGGTTATGGGATDESDEFEIDFGREALVLLELARKSDLSSLEDLGTGQLADLYALLADLKNSAEDARTEVRDALLADLRNDCEITAELGSVERRTYEYRRLEDEATVRDALEAADVDPESVRSFDSSKLREAVEETDLDEEAVFDIEERAQIRVAGSNDDRRRRRVERLDDAVRSLADE